MARHPNVVQPIAPTPPDSGTGYTTQPASAPVTAGNWFQQNMPPSTSAPDPMQGQLSQSFGAGAPSGGFGGQFVAPTGVDMQNDPGYQFRIDQGNRAVQNSAFSRGTGLTGGALKDLLGYSQGLASQEYGNVFNRALAGQTFNRDTSFGNQDRALNSYLAGRDTFWGDADRLFGRNFSLASLGANAAAGSNQNLGAFGQGGSDLLTGIGNARGGGSIGQGNALSSGITGGANMASLLAMLRQQSQQPPQAPVYGGGAMSGVHF